MIIVGVQNSLSIASFQVWMFVLSAPLFGLQQAALLYLRLSQAGERARAPYLRIRDCSWWLV